MSPIRTDAAVCRLQKDFSIINMIWNRISVLTAAGMLFALAGLAQQQPPVQVPFPQPLPQQQQQQQQPPQQPPPQQPVQVPATPGAPGQAPAPAPAGGGMTFGGLTLQNASLVEVIDMLARQLKINYILDPRVRGGVILNTYGEIKDLDTRNLLDIILRINGAAMVQVGDLYRIVPLSEISRQPLPPEVNPPQISRDRSDEDQTMLNLVFLKYVTVDELTKILQEFAGENSKLYSYSPSNLLFILDSRRNMKRLMELVSLFDSDALAKQRVRLFEVKNGRPSELAKELESVLKAISLTEKSATVRFLPVDRINTLIAIAPNPGVFDTVEEWLKKLDVEAQSSGTIMDSYVYRVKYARAQCLALALSALYGFGSPSALTMMGGFGFGGMGMGGMGGGGGGGISNFQNSADNCGGLMGMGMGGFGFGGMGMGGMGFGGFPGMGGMGMGGMGFGGFPGMGMMGVPGMGMPGTASIPAGGGFAAQTPTGAGATAAAPGTGAGSTGDLTGNYLGAGMANAMFRPDAPRIVPNPLDNSLLIQSTPSDYQQILKILRQLDIPPRQILMEARIYEVSLTGAFASGVQAFLQKRSNQDKSFLGSLAAGATLLQAGTVVGASRELLAFLRLEENTTRIRVVSAPSLIATDSIPAVITVGSSVPTLTAQGSTGVQTGGNTQFAQQIQNRNAGVTLQVNARVNPSGVVTLIINQEVSAPIPPAAGGIQSPSFSQRVVQTQITMQDGDTIAIGGIITENMAQSSAGIPLLHRLPIIGGAFGNKSYNKDRTELIVFMTPRIIYDNADLLDASDELKARLRRLQRVVKE
jgi:general secretion pathway protein D